jgi:ribosomal protein S27E
LLKVWYDNMKTLTNQNYRLDQGNVNMEFYCVKCRKKVEIAEEKITSEDKGNKRLFRAKCPNCGTNTAKFGKKG